jgi:hypothetical protein
MSSVILSYQVHWKVDIALVLQLLTICIPYGDCVPESNGNGQAQKEQDPVDFRYVDLAMDFFGRVNHFDPGEAAERYALLYD